jgi:hypothetical protein
MLKEENPWWPWIKTESISNCPNCGPNHDDTKCKYRFNSLNSKWFVFSREIEEVSQEDLEAAAEMWDRIYDKLLKNEPLYKDKLHTPLCEPISIELENKLLRKLLWEWHSCEGCYQYGDDDELQCHGIDFKRDPVIVILSSFDTLKLNRLRKTK